MSHHQGLAPDTPNGFGLETDSHGPLYKGAVCGYTFYDAVSVIGELVDQIPGSAQ